MIHGLRNIVLDFHPQRLIAPGEFGPETKALAASCIGLDTETIWYQHTPFVQEKLWFFNHPAEIGDIVPGNTKKIERGLIGEFMPVADRILVWSQESKVFLSQASHYPQERCEIVESVRYSDLLKLKSRLVKDNLSQKKYCFSPTVSKGEVSRFCYFISELCKAGIIRQDEIILKLHPSVKDFFNPHDVFSNFSEVDFNKLELVFDSAGMEQIFVKSACIICGGTTLGIEAAFFGIPVIQYIPAYGLNWSPFDESFATCFFDVDSLKEILKDLRKVKPINYRLFYAEPTLTNRRFQDAISR
jgi:hypothetical protein